MSTVPAKRPEVVISPVSEITQQLQAQITELARACPKHLTPERMITVVGLLAYRNRTLTKCDKASILRCTIEAATLGFDLSPSLPEGYLIPRWNRELNGYECTFMPGFRGIAKLARQAGNLHYLIPKIVREADTFREYYDPEPRFELEVYRKGDRGAMTHVVTLAKLPTGEIIFDVMDREQILHVRDKSVSWKEKPESSPWTNDEEEMWKKSGVKRFSKIVPLSPDLPPGVGTALATALEIDNRDYQITSESESHRALNFNNDTGHGVGAYAPPHEVQVFTDWCKAYCEEINQKWLDSITDKQTGEVVHSAPGEIITTYQLSGYLLKWAKAKGIVNAPEDIRAGSRDKYVAVPFSREPQRCIDEAAAYCRIQWADARKKIKAKAAQPSPPVREREPGDDDLPGDDEDDVLDEIAARQGEGL